MMNDVVIIGGGIIGLATGLQLKKQNPKLSITLLEKEDGVSKHQTGNNSGVIHSGIYYKPGSNKAINCKEGYDMLLNYCKDKNIPFDLCGKIIVATKEEELERLTNIYDRGIENGLIGIKYLNEKEIKEHEPNCSGIKGIWVPQTGIIDYKVVAESYANDFKTLGGKLLLGKKVTDVKSEGEICTVFCKEEKYEARLIINCAGLYCDKIAHYTGLGKEIKIIPFRGEYYQLKPNAAKLVKNLIYPVPDPKFPFLGVHFTRRITGEIEAGPNAVLAYKREGYKKSDINLGELFESLTWRGFRKVAIKYWRMGMHEVYRSYSKSSFTKALQELIPSVKKSDLEVGGAGVRAQACHKDGTLLDDFYFAQTDNMIHVLNAPSPAATSSLSIGKKISGMALETLKS
jgi:L-2-hydroxyglutarate oxidase